MMGQYQTRSENDSHLDGAPVETEEQWPTHGNLLGKRSAEAAMINDENDNPSKESKLGERENELSLNA